MKVIRWTLTIVAPVVGVFAGMMSREWRDDVLGAFPFVVSSGPISWRAIAFWSMVFVPIVSAAWQIYATQKAQRIEDERRVRQNAVHADAVALTVSRFGDDTTLWITNRGTHVITEISVNAIADDAGSPSLPELVSSQAPEVAVTYPIMGGWFFTKITRLSPGAGRQIGTSRFGSRDFTRIDFDISWNDHEGRRRKSHAVTDLRLIRNEIPLKPRHDPVESD